MWVDDTGGGADTTDGQPEGEMAISVDGHEYAGEVNYDANHDGVDDTVRMENADGTMTGYVDTDHDGHADMYLHTDAQGNVVERATFDAATGSWVDAGGGHDSGGGNSDAGSHGQLTADMPNGEIAVGPATQDTDHDGTNDTAVVTDEQGNTRMFTDTDGDGKADIQVVVDQQGHSTTYHHTGPGQWTEDSGSGARSGDGVAQSVPADSDQAWGGGQEPVEGVARIDSVTGQWISQN